MKKILPGTSESLVRRAALLRLTTRALAENMLNGGFRSLYRGQGIEFNGVREYIPGDDIRAIDWNVTARMDRPFVKMLKKNGTFCFSCCLLFIFDEHGSSAGRVLKQPNGSAHHGRSGAERESGRCRFF